jgi:heme exporter protein A
MTSKLLEAGILLDASFIPLHLYHASYFPAFQVKPGEAVRIKGPNGSGKTTMLKALSGAIYDEKMTLSSSPSYYLSDQVFDMPGVTVSGYIEYLNCLFSCCRSTATVNQIDPDLLIDLLSLGQKQYLKLCALDYIDAKIWLLDEPERGLDQKMQRLLKKKVWDFVEQGNAVIYASHLDCIEASREVSV